MKRKLLPTTFAFTVCISTKGYYGTEQHKTMTHAYWRAKELVRRTAVVVRRRHDGKRYSVEELDQYGWEKLDANGEVPGLLLTTHTPTL